MTKLTLISGTEYSILHSVEEVLELNGTGTPFILNVENAQPVTIFPNTIASIQTVDTI